MIKSFLVRHKRLISRMFLVLAAICYKIVLYFVLNCINPELLAYFPGLYSSCEVLWKAPLGFDHDRWWSDAQLHGFFGQFYSSCREMRFHQGLDFNERVMQMLPDKNYFPLNRYGIEPSIHTGLPVLVERIHGGTFLPEDWTPSRTWQPSHGWRFPVRWARDYDIPVGPHYPHTWRRPEHWVSDEEYYEQNTRSCYRKRGLLRKTQTKGKNQAGKSSSGSWILQVLN